MATREPFPTSDPAGFPPESLTPPVDDGGPAFPVSAESYRTSAPGMYLRDWFAGQALAGILASLPKEISFKGANAKHDLAGDSYEIADAMLSARKGGE